MNDTRVELIRSAIEQRLTPQQLDVEDESALHAGHPGARGGAGHFRVHVVSEQFRGKSMIQRHRLVYEAVGDLMGRDIHALAIDARTPDEIAS